MVRLNEHGNSYILVLIMSAIIATSSTAVMNLIENSQNEVTNIYSKHGQLALAADIANAVQLREACNLQLTTTGFNPAGVTPAQLRWNVADKPAGRPQRIDLNTEIPDYNIMVKSLNIENVRLIGMLSPTRTLYVGSLVMQSQSMSVSQPYRPLNVAEMYFEVEGTSVVNCYRVSEVIHLSQSLCTGVGAEINSDQSCSLRPNLPPTRCPANHYLQGFSAGGGPNCVAY